MNMSFKAALTQPKSATFAEMVNMDINFEQLAYDHVLEVGTMIDELQIYRTMLESGDSLDGIRDTFREFIAKMTEIITKTKKFIKDLIDRFLLWINKLAQSESYLMKNHQKLSEFDESKHGFSYEGFRYTVYPNLPIVNMGYDFVNDFINIQSVKDVDINHKLLKKRISGGLYDEYRATIIGRHGKKIAADRYGLELYGVFRDDSDEPERIEVTPAVLQECRETFVNYAATERDIKSTQNELVKQYNAVITSFQSAQSKYLGVSGIQSETLAYDLFMKTKVQQVKTMSDIHTLAFGAKLNALKSKLTESRTVIYQALSNIEREK